LEVARRRRFARSVKWLGQQLGLSISRFPPRSSLEFHLRELFGSCEINCVVDVGAHTGGYVRLIRKVVGFRGPIVSFEPAPKAFQTLEAAWGRDPAWRGYRYALGRSRAQAEFREYRSSDFNSLLQPSRYGARRFPKNLQPVSTQPVEVRTLSELFGEITEGLEAPQVHLKSDTQGFDLEVVEGAVGVLDRIFTLQIELSFRQIYEEQPAWLDVLRRLGELGYEACGFFPITAEGNTLALIEADCLLVRTR
jgi:FkbM family methyltransferase